MGSMYVLSAIFLLIQCNNILVRCDTFIPDKTYHVPVKGVNRPTRQFVDNSQFPAVPGNFMGAPRQPVFHTNTVESQPKSPILEEQKQAPNNMTLSELVNAFNDLSEHEEQPEQVRSVPRDYGYSPYGYRPQVYDYPSRPNYGQWSPPAYSSYHEPSYYPPPPSPLAPPHHSLSKISLLKPSLDLVKPVTTKVASKVSGLIGLVLALLTGSSPNDLELKGFKDIVINGIVKPLLLAKGGIKTLISKLTIPVISLLLINLEVLITVWWLWEDCPEPAHAPPPYSYPKPIYNYNTY
ncbi:uncharacterized protein LOC131841089 [Achroia grisella]|uniref:uncharacterized protein LOC131841089 n=1 Tax=Achroia grisella TaxID=688607 RepID=UPI0027D2E8C8|nr:uncharacterized protein LOC131841089 [Achroia grisella]